MISNTTNYKYYYYNY